MVFGRELRNRRASAMAASYIVYRLVYHSVVNVPIGMEGLQRVYPILS